MSKIDEAFKKFHSSQMNLMSQILGGDNKIDTLFVTPLMGNTEEETVEMLIAMVIQNQFQAKNSDRVEAIRSKKYVELEQRQQSKEYLTKLAEDMLMNDLKGQESAEVKSY